MKLNEKQIEALRHFYLLTEVIKPLPHKRQGQRPAPKK